MKALQDLLGRAPAARRIAMHIEDLAARWTETLGADTAAERLEQLRTDLADGVEAAREAMSEVDPNAKADTRNAQAALDAVTAAKEAADGLAP